MRPISERLSPAIRNLVIAQAALFFLYIMADSLRIPIKAHLALGPLVAAGELWQPATSLFVHLDPWGFVFDLIGLWFVGATIEQVLGRRRFLVLFLGTGLAANLAVAFVMAGLRWSGVYAGCGDAVLALFVALGVIYGPTQVRVLGPLVLQARVLTAILVGLSIVGAISQAAWPSLAGTLVAVCVGYFLSGGKWRSVAAWLGRFRGKRRSVLGVLEGGRGKGGKNYVN
jgi:membrane associated rhomboid family serine protease